MRDVKASAYRRAAGSRLTTATYLIIQAVLSKEIASSVSEPLRGDINKSAEKSISWIIDDWCGTPSISHRPPKPLPGPTGLDLALAVATFANLATKSGSFRDELMKIAGQITESAYRGITL
jgi:hypothetical protein